jgi:hypothetical protein
MRKLAMIAGACTLALGAISCSDDTPAENQVERQAEAIDEAYEADADLQESLAQGAPDEKAQEEQADQLREQGDAVREDLKQQADEMGHDTRAMQNDAH